MANTITGRVLNVGQTMQITSQEGKTFLKRELLLDCTKYDPYTGEREQFENTPFLEFSGEKGVAELDNVKTGDIVTVSFDVSGIKYEKNSEVKYFTKIRPYKVENRRKNVPEQQAVSQVTKEKEEEDIQEDDMPF